MVQLNCSEFRVRLRLELQFHFADMTGGLPVRHMKFNRFRQPSPNPALNGAPFGRWTLRRQAGLRPLALR